MRKKYRSPLRWMGGKFYHTRDLIPLMPQCKRYIEPFCGGLSVLFARAPVPTEIVNDLDGNLVNFWRVVKGKPEELIESFQFTPLAREIHAEYRRIYLSGQYEQYRY